MRRCFLAWDFKAFFEAEKEEEKRKEEKIKNLKREMEVF